MAQHTGKHLANAHLGETAQLGQPVEQQGLFMMPNGSHGPFVNMISQELVRASRSNMFDGIQASRRSSLSTSEASFEATASTAPSTRQSSPTPKTGPRTNNKLKIGIQKGKSKSYAGNKYSAAFAIRAELGEVDNDVIVDELKGNAEVDMGDRFE